MREPGRDACPSQERGIGALTYRLGDSGERSRARRLSTGSSDVLFEASSLRSLPRSQPPCTNVSLPSGRTSVTVACRSTFGFEARTQTCTAPAPITVVFALSGFVRYDTPLPAGGWSHLYGGVAVHRPFSPPAVSPVKSVGVRAFAFQVNEFVPAFDGALSASLPPLDRYHERPVVPGTGNFANECSKPGCGAPGMLPPAPLSNRMRTEGCASNACCAMASVSCCWIGSGGHDWPGTPMASW